MIIEENSTCCCYGLLCVEKLMAQLEERRSLNQIVLFGSIPREFFPSAFRKISIYFSI